MTVDVAINLLREALFLIVMLVGLIVGPGLCIGLVVAVFQAATQINEQTLSFLPRLLVTLLTIMMAGPWILSRLMSFMTTLYTNIPLVIG